MNDYADNDNCNVDGDKFDEDGRDDDDLSGCDDDGDDHDDGDDDDKCWPGGGAGVNSGFNRRLAPAMHSS